jgi:hypothetical protein
MTLCSTDDRYADDAHYMGGCLLNENLTWGSVLLTFNAYPPDPAIVGESWRATWLRRMEATPLFPAVWMNHPWRDRYWKHGSVCEDLSAIRCPVYAIGGWADGYSNAVPRLLEGLSAPRKGLIGPWSHAFPHDAVPGPSIGFLQEAIRWWDRWLKGVDDGIMDEPMLRVWMQESVPPRPTYAERPGRWVAETAWPPRRDGRLLEPLLYRLAPGALVSPPDVPGAAPEPAADDREAEIELRIASPQVTGQAAGEWCAFGAEGEMPTDQREEDGRSLTFDSSALPDRLEILGAPVAVLELAADRPVAMVAVRLCDVAPDGASTRVSYGLLNLTHRQSHEHPEPLEPGRRVRVRIRLNDVAHAFPAGHVVRLAVSTGSWPMAWPSPERVTLTLVPGTSHLELPVRPPAPEDTRLRDFAAPEQGPSLEHTPLRPAHFRRTIERDLLGHGLGHEPGEGPTTTQTIFTDGGEFEGAALTRVDDIALELGTTVLRRYTITERAPLSARAEVQHRTELGRPGWRVRVETDTELTADHDTFRLRAQLRGYEDDRLVFHRVWDRRVPRKLV